MRYCQSCGEKVSDSASFCEHCGVRVSEGTCEPSSRNGRNERHPGSGDVRESQETPNEVTDQPRPQNQNNVSRQSDLPESNRQSGTTRRNLLIGGSVIAVLGSVGIVKYLQNRRKRRQYMYGLGSQGETAPTAAFDFEGENGSIQVTFSSGSRIDANNVEILAEQEEGNRQVRITQASEWESLYNDSQLTSGSSATFSATPGTYEVRVIWTQGVTSQTIDEAEVTVG